MTEYIAHISDDGREQSVDKHLKETAELARNFSIEALKDVVNYVGLMHDIGKYRKGFQRRIRGEKIKCEHAACAAQEIIRKMGGTQRFLAYMLAYCTAGHHTGLADGGHANPPKEKTLCAALNRNLDDYKDYSEFFDFSIPDQNALARLIVQNCDPKDKVEFFERFSFFTKYIFSCLTDADYLNTESFCQKNSERGITGDFQKALELVDAKIQKFEQSNDVKKARTNLQNQAFENSDDSQISLLNMPTGSGKTLCSIRLALEKAVREKKKRIIYVIPYTVIIEQTANEFNDIFGKVLPVLQHHSNYSYDKKDENETADYESTEEKLKRTCENWDAPLIITTNVQFFESLYHHKGSKLRKMHNMADSIIVFDEIHMMPVPYLQPCLRAVDYVTSYLNSNAIFLSATMPNFKELFEKYIKLGKQKELITDKHEFEYFKKCNYEYINKCTPENIINRAKKFESSLIIVNTKKEANEFYKLCTGKKFHLSTYMTPAHRSKVIEEIKSALKAKEKITVISTSLVECGVDFDFEAVFRELTGLDSIIQSGGRCNREGERDSGFVYIFENSEKKPSKAGAERANICKKLLTTFNDVLSPECIEEYYQRLYNFNDNRIKENSIAADVEDINDIPFRTYSEQFKLIESSNIGIVIPNEENADLLEQLKHKKMSAMRKLQKYTATVTFSEFNNMLERGVIADDNTGVYHLTVAKAYQEETGLDTQYVQNTIF